MLDIAERSGDEIIHPNNFATFGNKPIAKVRT
jgi:hypothetical protein